MTPWIGPDESRPHALLPGRANVRVDKNCYFPEEPITITLRNVGGGHLLYDYMPDFEVRGPVHGTVRMILARWFPMDFILHPGESHAWTWDQHWQAEDENGTRIHIGEFVPEGEYTVSVKVLMGTNVQTIGQAPFVIGFCDFQVSAGDDRVVDEGVEFRPAPTIGKTGTANLTSVTWDLDSAVDGNGDGNPTNDADAVGERPEITFGDDGVYPVTLNVRGFLANATVRPDQDVVFAIDSSGSMAWNDPGDLRKEASKSYVNLLVPDDRAAVVDFDTIAVLVNDDHLSSDYPLVKQNIDRIDSVGGTILSIGLEEALDELQLSGDPRHVWVVIFLTDAESITEDDDLLVPLAVDRAVALGVRIYAVGLSVPAGLLAFMETIASRTGGKFYLAPTADTLLDIYEDIGDEVRESRGSFFLASDAMVVTVRNVAPTVAASAEVTTAVALAAAITDPGTDDVTVTIDWGDGVTSATTYFNDGVGPDPNPSPGGMAMDLTLEMAHTYASPGTYVIAVNATDDDGGWAETRLVVDVEAWQARQFKLQAAQFLEDALVADPDDADLMDALGYLYMSLGDNGNASRFGMGGSEVRWAPDGIHVDDAHGGYKGVDVFQYEEESVDKLIAYLENAANEHTDVNDVIPAVIELMRDADRTLTTIAIGDAEAVGGDPDLIAVAWDLLAEADAYWETGDLGLLADYVIDKLEESWEKAIQAYRP